MRRPLLLLALASVVTAAAVGAGVVLAGEDTPTEAAAPATRPLSELDTDDAVVRRADFCADLDPEAVAELLGAPPDAAEAWGNGQRLPASTGLRDVAHEYGCRWAAGQEAVEAWVFVPPVDAARARQLATAAREVAGCEPVPGAVPLGAPTAALACPADPGGAGGPGWSVTYAGLVGDAWLTCRASGGSAGDRDSLLERADRWCGAVLTAAG